MLDDPDTRWSELKVFGMLYLHPFPSTYFVSCDGITLPRGMRCIEKEYEDAWNAFAAARESYLTTEIDSRTAVESARNKVVSARNALDDAERALEIAQSDRPQASAASIQSELDAANASLECAARFPGRCGSSAGYGESGSC